LRAAQVLQAMFSPFTRRLMDRDEIERMLSYFASIPML
jgi:hypothetical protein